MPKYFEISLAVTILIVVLIICMVVSYFILKPVCAKSEFSKTESSKPESSKPRFSEHIYAKAFSHILKNEGGLTNHKYDVGGTTKFGISLAFLKAENIDINLDGVINKDDIIYLSINDAYILYKEYFWDKLSLDLIEDPSLAIVILDSAVNMGVNTAVRLIQKILYCYNDIKSMPYKVDGLMGPKTITRINYINKNHIEFKELFLSSLSSKYINLCNKNPKLRVFFNGWINRVNENRAMHCRDILCSK